MKQRQNHNIEPVYDQNSKILILGSFPSVKSRESEFFYSHPQNRFWRVTSAVLECKCPKTVQEKKEFLLSCGIAVWDVIKSCDIEGSSDSSISNVVPNDIGRILGAADIRAVFTNGGTSTRLYKKFIQPKEGIPSVPLPSTSPANARYTLEHLICNWSKIKEFL